MVREATQWEREEMEKVVRDNLCSRICSWQWLCQACESQGRCHRLSLLHCSAMGSSALLSAPWEFWISAPLSVPWGRALGIPSL